MLTFQQLEDAGEAVVRIMAKTEQTILNDMARRIARMGGVSMATFWQAERLEILGTQQKTIIRVLSNSLYITEQRLIELFDEAATRTLGQEYSSYHAREYKPIPLAENWELQQIIRAGLVKTLGTFQNLTLTTANTATLQFERALDHAHQLMASGGYSYQQAIREGVRSLAKDGIESIRYPTGHVDRLDTAFRRAAITGINQTAAEVQLENMRQLGLDLVETTAHPGARPDHAIWQGQVFSVSGTHEKYPDFKTETGYGTGSGLCGWNCRHSFFGFLEGSDPAYTAEKLREYNNKQVTYNKKTMDLYDATQQQRYIERQIRRWKREGSAFDAAGLDNKAARAKVHEWQATQRDFIKQTGLTRDYFRERGGNQLIAP